jgi:phosphoribosylglycinamide formyltransferase-1
MRLFSENFTKHLGGGPQGTVRAVNIHPSLLPAFPGVDSYAQAYAHGVKVTGCTVHLLSSKMDDGPIVAQSALALHEGETLASLKERGHALEHEIYGATIARLARGGWTLVTPAGGTRQKVVFP